jgi:hypothetical protein
MLCYRYIKYKQSEQYRFRLQQNGEAGIVPHKKKQMNGKKSGLG